MFEKKTDPSAEDEIQQVPHLGGPGALSDLEITEEKKDFDTHSNTDIWTPPSDWIARFIESYSGQHAGETLPPGADVERTALAIFTRDQQDSVVYLTGFLEEFHDDYTINTDFQQYIRDLILGAKHCQMDDADWAYEIARVAGTCDNWSPYAEVRAVLLPYDDPEMACETLRAYVIGSFWIIIGTFVNVFFSQRQPGISFPGALIQLMMVPMGRFAAAVLPDWGVTIRGKRHSLNPGPWTNKEQLMTTLMMFTDQGCTTGLLALKVPMFFGQPWVNFGYMLLLAISNQGFGLGFAGMLRRIVVYPTQAVYPNSLPELALNRTLINSENKKEVINGWKITRWHCFIFSSLILGVYYWIPNQFLLSIRYFNWMTWIAPASFSLALVTGSYGGLGFNPIPTLDPNVGGGGTMNTPFFAQLQQYTLRLVSGLVLLIMYYRNVSWGAYMPLNSNGTFDNKFNDYNMSRVLNADNTLNVEAYKAYSPPYYPISYLWTMGVNNAYYTFSAVYVFTRYRKVIWNGITGVFLNTFRGRSVYHGFNDGNSRLMRQYPEVPEWWYAIILLGGFIMSICTVAAYPTGTPWWTILAVFALGVVMTIPEVILHSIAAVDIPLSQIWGVLPGVWFPGTFLPNILLQMLGDAFGAMASNFAQTLKTGHYARIPPRTIFRTHLWAIFLNALIIVSTVTLLEAAYNSDGTFCSWDNKQFMVCAGVHGFVSGVIGYGALGTRNLYKLYPALPWCFLLGAGMAVLWFAGEAWAPKLRLRFVRDLGEEETLEFDRKWWTRLSNTAQSINPAIALRGAAGWSGNNNLGQVTLGLYLSWLFQYYLKRNYTAWWGKYAFMIFAALGIAYTVSGLIGTLVFSFGAGKDTTVLNYRANDIGRTGIDYDLYTNSIALLPLPEKGYFGLDPGQYPI